MTIIPKYGKIFFFLYNYQLFSIQYLTYAKDLRQFINTNLNCFRCLDSKDVFVMVFLKKKKKVFCKDVSQNQRSKPVC